MFKNSQWSPYVAGALTGIVIILSVLIAGQYFGASTSFVRTAGIIESQFIPERVAEMEYYVRVDPKLDWQWFFVIGILLGSFVAAKTGGSFKFQAVPDMWHARFGNTPVKRGITAFAGGAVLMFGARMADGWPSGHGLSGTLQLSISGILSLALFLIAGIIMARFVYGGGK